MILQLFEFFFIFCVLYELARQIGRIAAVLENLEKRRAREEKHMRWPNG